jgi:hypothetical protein
VFAEFFWLEVTHGVSKLGKMGFGVKESRAPSSDVRRKTWDRGAEPISVRPPADPMSGQYSCLDSEAQDSLVARRVRQMTRAYGAQKYEEALGCATRVLSIMPGHPHAIACADACSNNLERDYVACLGGMSIVLEIVVEGSLLRDLLRDPRTAFLVPLIDGELSLDEVLDHCGERRLDALRVLVELAQKGAIRSV